MLWGLLWASKTKLDGLQQHLIYEECYPKFFHTRKESRKYSQEKFGYIKTRKDLREEPHGWKMPIPVKIKKIKWFNEQQKEK